MGNITHTLGGATIFLTQAHAQAAGAYPVTIDCALSALDQSFNPTGITYPHLDETVSSKVVELVPGTVATGLYELFGTPVGENTEIKSVASTRSAKITIDQKGYISSIESSAYSALDDGRLQEFNSKAILTYSNTNFDVTFITDHSDRSLNQQLVEHLSVITLQTLDHAMRQCVSPDLISSVKPNTASFRLG